MKNTSIIKMMAYCGAVVLGSFSYADNATERLVRIPAGVNEGIDVETHIPYKLEVSSGLLMDATEVTVESWRAVKDWAGKNGYEFDSGNGVPDYVVMEDGPHLPARCVSWYDCIKWCNARSEREGLKPVYSVSQETYRRGQYIPRADMSASGYRLPTEDEWQYAARGGLRGCRFPWGDTISHENANYQGMKGDSAWIYDLSEGPHPKYKDNVAPVGSFKPNGYGLFDMAGNVWEWTWNDSDSSDYAPMRGGCYHKGGHFQRIGRPDGALRKEGDQSIGFRCIRLDQKNNISRESKSHVQTVKGFKQLDKSLKVNLSSCLQKANREWKSPQKMHQLMHSMATFPSCNPLQAMGDGESYRFQDWICILIDNPRLSIDAEHTYWLYGMERQAYEKRVKEIQDIRLSYKHSIAVYNLRDGIMHEPTPRIVFAIETSRTARYPYICAFTPDGHKNFGSQDADTHLTALNILSTIESALDGKWERIGDAITGWKTITGEEKQNTQNAANVTSSAKNIRRTARCSDCQGTGLAPNKSLCPKCQGFGKLPEK